MNLLLIIQNNYNKTLQVKQIKQDKMKRKFELVTPGREINIETE